MMVAFSTALPAQDVRRDYDHHVNFENFHTYSWQQVKANDPSVETRISGAVDRALIAKGLQRVDANGDVTLAAVASLRRATELHASADGLLGGYWPGRFGNESPTSARDSPMETVVIDMYDAQNKHLIWRSMAEHSISADEQENEHNLTTLVDRMLKDFPAR